VASYRGARSETPRLQRRGSDALAAQRILGLRRFGDRRRSESSALRPASLCARDGSAQSVRSLSDEWRGPSGRGAMVSIRMALRRDRCILASKHWVHAHARTPSGCIRERSSTCTVGAGIADVRRAEAVSR
jgi:hypothetical protein